MKTTSLFENRLYERYLRDYSSLINKYYREIAIAALSDNVVQMEKFLLQAFKKEIINRQKIYVDANEKFIKAAKAITGTDPTSRSFNKTLLGLSDEKVAELWELRIERLDDNKRRALFKKIIYSGADLAASCKYISQSKNFSNKYQDKLTKWATPNMNVAKARANEVNACRNNYLGHNDDINISLLDRRVCEQSLKVINDAGQTFGNIDNRTIEELTKTIKEKYSKLINLINLKPISVKDLEKSIEGFSTDGLIYSWMVNEYDPEEQVLYFHTLNEVEEQFKKYTADASATEQYREMLAEKEAALSDSSRQLTDAREELASYGERIDRINQELEASDIKLDKANSVLAATKERLEKATYELQEEKSQNESAKVFVNSFSNLIKDSILPEIMKEIEAEIIKKYRVSNENDNLGKETQNKTVVKTDSAGEEANNRKANIENVNAHVTEQVKGIQTKAFFEKEADAMESLSGNSISKDLIRRVAIAKAFPEMAKYEGGRITSEQLDELAYKTTVIADASFWMNKKNANFLARTFAGYLKKNKRKLVIDWNSRVELFKYERNTAGNSTEAEVSNAKFAHHIMHMMVSKSFATYLPSTDIVCSSDFAIMKLAKDNPDVVFTVFSNSNEFTEKLADENLSNIIPISFIAPTNMCIVKQSLKDKVMELFSGSDIDTELIMSQETMKDDLYDEEITEDAEERNSSNSIDIGEALIESSVLTDDDSSKHSNNEKKTASKKHSGSEEHSDNGQYHNKYKHFDLIEESNVQLPVDGIILKGSIVYDASGNAIQIGRKIGTGGEGTVFSCSINDKVIKIYHKDKLTATRKDKLELMIRNNPNSKKICWPEQLIFNENEQFVGFLMRSAAGYDEFGTTVLKLNSATVASKSMKGWDRLALVELCKDLCNTFQNMHKAGVLMGDVNPRNMLLNKSDTNIHNDYVLVDCDSYQIGGYPCPVGTTVFTSPKIYERNNSDSSNLNFGKFLRTREDEYYSIASLLFHILMLNQSPFAMKNGSENIEDAIRNYEFAYRIRGEEENTGADVPDGVFRMIWNNMPTYVKESFGDVFKRGKDVSVQTWINNFERYEKDLKNKRYARELKPVLYRDATGTFTKMFTCALCGKERNMPKDRYENQEKYNQPHLCNDCMTIRNRAKEDTATAKCGVCGKEYITDKWDEWLIDKGYKKPMCNSCGERRVFQCDFCGNNSEMLKIRYDEQTRRNQPHLCKKCRDIKEQLKTETVIVSCDWCHNTYETDRWDEWLINKGHKRSRCPKCRAEYKEIRERINNRR